MRTLLNARPLLAAAAIAGCVAMPAWAIDGVVLIDQNKAASGNVTPGDTPGFPVTITVPGSYRLAGNLTVPDGNTTAIVVTADNVSIDLNGFQIAGPGGSGTGKGIDATGRLGVVVANGTVYRMGGSGIVTGPSARIDKVQANNNGGNGIDVDTLSIVNDSIAHNNNGNGVQASPKVTVQNCNLSFNGVRGIAGSRAGAQPLYEGALIVRGNILSRNVLGGVDVNAGVITGNTVEANGFAGIYTSAIEVSVVSGNVVTGNKGYGILMGPGTLTGNTIYGNTGAGASIDTFVAGNSLGYKGNVFGSNAGGNVVVFVGTARNLGDNLCDGGVCP